MNLTALSKKLRISQKSLDWKSTQNYDAHWFKTTQMWYLTDKGFKVVSINVFRDIKDDVVIRNKHTGKTYQGNAN